MNHPQTRYLGFIAVVFFAILLAVPTIISAQATATPEGTPIEISGVVSQIGSGTLTVAGLTVNVSSISVDTNIVIGTTVTVTGHLLSTNVVVAQVIVIVPITATPTAEATTEATAEVTSQATVSATASATPTLDTDIIIIIEGPVVNIVTNIITIYDFDIEVEPTHPLLNIIQIGDVIHIEGSFSSSGVIVASLVSNVTTVITSTTGVTASLDGPIESINGNIVIVNGIPIQFAADDPQLTVLQVGDFLSVQGNFENNGTTIVLIVVNITIINNVIVNGDPACWYHVDGMGMGMGMGHWHCDGMGMGMGMGDDGMGMGMGG